MPFATPKPCCARDVMHALRFPVMTISGMTVPVCFLLLFVGVFGNTLRAGLGAAAAHAVHYVDYLTPGVILMTASSAVEATAVNICTDIRRHHRPVPMAITRTSVLIGQ